MIPTLDIKLMNVLQENETITTMASGLPFIPQKHLHRDWKQIPKLTFNFPNLSH